MVLCGVKGSIIFDRLKTTLFLEFPFAFQERGDLLRNSRNPGFWVKELTFCNEVFNIINSQDERLNVLSTHGGNSECYGCLQARFKLEERPVCSAEKYNVDS